MTVRYPPNLAYPLGCSNRGPIRGLLQRPMENHPSVCTRPPNYPPRPPPDPTTPSPYSYLTSTHPISAYTPLGHRESPDQFLPPATDPDLTRSRLTTELSGPLSGPAGGAASPPPSPPLGNRSRTILGIMRAGKQRRLANLMTKSGQQAPVCLPRIDAGYDDYMAEPMSTHRLRSPSGARWVRSPRGGAARGSLEQRLASAMRQYGSLYRQLLADAPPMELSDYQRLLRMNPEGAPQIHKQHTCHIDSVREVSSVDKTLTWLMDCDFQPQRPPAASAAARRDVKSPRK